MKIASGKYKNKSLIVPKSGVKPTTDKVRQAIMNILQNSIEGAKFLDLYSGTGAVGIEALSNGAVFSCFIEKTDKLYSILKKNLEAIVCDKTLYKTIKHNVVHLDHDMLNEYLPFDIVFADPFYQDTLNWMDELHHNAMSYLADGGIFILEHSDKDDYSRYPYYKLTKRYGDTALSIFEKPREAL